ncbi:MAG: VOC family protein [Sphingomonadales bacterium]|jgi:hypothetical protein
MLRLRQIAVVAPDLPPVEAEFCETLGTGVCYRDPGVGKYGLHNALWALGGTFLEALAPLQPGTTAGRYIERRGGPTGYMVILDSDDLAPVRARLAAHKVRIVEDLTVDYHGSQATALHLHPRDAGGCLLSLDQHGPDGGMTGNYAWAGPGWQAHMRADMAITGALLASDDPVATAAHWGALLGLAPARHGIGWRISLDHGALDFTTIADDRGEGLAAIRLSGLAHPTRICGIDLLPEEP